MWFETGLNPVSNHAVSPQRSAFSFWLIANRCIAAVQLVGLLVALVAERASRGGDRIRR